MKTSSLIIIIIAIFLAGCKTQQKASVSSNDDVYYSKSKSSEQAVKVTDVNADLSAPQNLASDSSSSGKSASSTFADDYNDYSYAARINRFSHPDNNRSYYDEAYTNTVPMIQLFPRHQM